MKKILTYFLILSTLFTVGNSFVFASNGVDLSTKIENSSFEYPSVVGKRYRLINASDVPGWNTTAHGQKIEIFEANDGYYINNVYLEPRSGKQAAELNVDEQSTLYQTLNTVPGSLIRWGISHRGRNGLDTMLLIIGPKQKAEPIKPGKDEYDQFMKIGQYVKENSELDSIISESSGCSKEIVVYSPKFAANGGFVTGNDMDFSLSKSTIHTEEWHLWCIKSDSDKWYDYGTNLNTESDELGYNNIYEVPYGQNETIFAFTAYDSVGIYSYSNKTTGNFIDAVDFGFLHRLNVSTMLGGNGYVYKNGDFIDPALAVECMGKADNTIKLKSGSDVDIVAKPLENSDYGFVGAFINGDILGYSDFNHDLSKGIYSKKMCVDKDISVRLIYSKNGHIIYDPNGGIFKNNKSAVDKEFSYYTNGRTEASAPIKDNAVFTGWRLFTNEDGKTSVVIPTEHSVTYDASDYEKPVLKISYKGLGNDIVLPANKENGISFVAEYSYIQRATVYTKNNNGAYEISSEGGRINIINNTSSFDVTGKNLNKSTSGRNGDVITLSAMPEDGYIFDGWFEDSDSKTPISKEYDYTYTVTDSYDVEARFSPAPVVQSEELKQDEKIEEVDDSEGKMIKVPNYVLPHFKNDYAYIYGYDSATIGPEGKLLRGELCAMVHRLAKQNNLLNGFEYDPYMPSTYDDIDDTWYRSAIEYIAYKNGFETLSGNIYADSSITRGEAIRIISIGLGYTDDTELSIDEYASIFVDAGFLRGYEDGTLKLSNTITRAEFCTLFNRIIGRDTASLIMDNGEEVSAEVYGFMDINPSDWYYEDMLRATSAYDKGRIVLEKRNVRNDLDDYNLEDYELYD